MGNLILNFLTFNRYKKKIFNGFLTIKWFTIFHYFIDYVKILTFNNYKKILWLYVCIFDTW